MNIDKYNIYIYIILVYPNKYKYIGKTLNKSISMDFEETV